MKNRKIFNLLVANCVYLGLLLPPNISAEEHNVLPEVTVVDTYISWWNPTWFEPVFSTSYTVQEGSYFIHAGL